MQEVSLISLVALGLAGVSIAWSFYLWRKLIVLSQGDGEKSLLALLESNAHKLEQAHNDYESFTAYAKVLDTRFSRSVQQVALRRFNPFDDAGGDNSFALALLDEMGDGVVISSLYGRESTSVYAKPVSKYTSAHQLSAEETQIIAQAREQANQTQATEHA